MMRRETIVGPFRPHPAARRLAPALLAALAMLGLVLPLGCARSPYRRALDAMDRETSTRLAAAVRRAADAQRSALRQMESAAALLARFRDREPSDSDWLHMEDAVQLSRVRAFNSARLVESVADAASEIEAIQAQVRSNLVEAPGGGLSETPVLLAHYSDVLTALRRSATLLDRAALDLNELLDALRPEAVAAEGPPAPPTPDLAPVRLTVQAAREQAAAFARLLRESDADEDDHGGS